MLSFFPNPYPDELWYSVLSRYHARCGNIGSSITTKELFGSGNIQPSIFYANQDFGGIFERLPGGLLDKEEVYHKHTIIPFVLRFSSEKKKKLAWNYVINGAEGIAGSNMFSLPGATHLRYCPVCNAEDTKQYGELFWHRLHQIPLMPLCPKHGCKLENSTVEVNAALGRRYILPTYRNCPEKESQFGNAGHEKALADMLVAFLTDDLPNESGFWCRVLSQVLKNAGLVFMEVEAHLVGERLLDFYGQTLVDNYFPKERMQPILYRMLKGQWSNPEQVALLAVALDMAPEWLTTPGHYIEDTMKAKLLEMASKRYVWKKQRVAEELGVTTWALDGIVKRLDIAPFWKTFDGRGAPGDDVIVRARISKEEKALWQRRAEELGTSDLTEYIKFCVRKEMTD